MCCCLRVVDGCAVGPDSVVEDGVCSIAAVSSCDAFATWLVVCPFSVVLHPVDDRCFVFIFDNAVEVEWGAGCSHAGAFAESVDLSCVDASVDVLCAFCPVDEASHQLG